MKISHYTVFYENYPVPGEYLLLNTRTQAVAVIGQELKNLLDRLAASAANQPEPAAVTNEYTLSTEDVIARIPSRQRRERETKQSRYDEIASSRSTIGLRNNKFFSPEEQTCLDQLKELGMVVDDETDELQVLADWFNRIKYQSAMLTATILTTYQCNFACTYCFEEKVKNNVSMSPETGELVIQWLKEQVTAKQPKTLRLVFYGGEPFLNPAPMLQIGEKLSNWSKSSGVKFNFGVISNGSVLNPSLVEQLRRVGLTNIRVTVDGPPEEHNARRPLRNGQGSFDLVLKNIMNVTCSERFGDAHRPEITEGRSRTIDKVRIDIGGNFDKGNLKSFYRLLDIFEERGLKKKLGTLLFAPVVARLGADENTIEMVGCTSLSNDMMGEALKLRRETIRRGFKVEKAVNITTCPMVRDSASVVIDPTGEIYKCPAFVGRPDFVVGNVREHDFNRRAGEFMEMFKPMDEKNCRECAYLPMCGGGCRFNAQLEHQDCSKPACDKWYYEKIFPELLKTEYERGTL